MSMWLVECPNLDQGLVRPIVTHRGTVVLMCDSAGEVWLKPEDISTVDPFIPQAPDWLVVDDIDVVPGSTRWASEQDVDGLNWDVEWQVD